MTRNRMCIVIAVLAWMGALASAGAQEPEPPAGPLAGAGSGGLPDPARRTPDVLVILADDIGWRDIDASVPTPNLDALARDGMRLRRAYAMPYCSPSRFALLFGMQPYRELLGTYIDPNLAGEVSVAPSRFSLASALRAEGYATLCAGKWHLSTFALGTPAAFDWPRRFGFDAFRAGRIGNIGQTVTYTYWPRIDDGLQTQSTEYNTTAVRRAAEDWWWAQDRPRFAYVAFHAAHAPFHTPPPALLPTEYMVGSSNRSRFEAMVVAMDAEIGRLLASVDRENTLVFFLGDNGTPTDAAAPGQDPTRLKGSVYEGGIQVPLIVAGQGVRRGAVSDSLVSLTDVYATVMDCLGLPVPPGKAIDSVSFAPVLRDPGRRTRAWVYSQRFTPNGSAPKTINTRTVVSQRYKLIDDGSRELLFDLLLDPGERTPLSLANRPRIHAALRQVMDRQRAQGAP